MIILSYEFFAFIALSLAAVRFVSGTWLASCLLILNLAFLWTINPGFQTVILLTLVGSLYSAATMRRWTSAGPRAAWIVVAASIYAFVALKGYDFVPGAMLAVELPVAVGLSYVVFRALQVTIDSITGDYDGRLPIVSYLNHSFGLLLLHSGPIQRYQDYKDQEADLAHTARPDQEVASKALLRTTTGYVKVVILGGILFSLFEAAVARTDGAGLRTTVFFAAATYLYLGYLYVTFSGHMDIILGLGRLIGFRYPENFDRPWRATNFLDIWRRWHMTLGAWFRVYVFNTMAKALLSARITARLPKWAIRVAPVSIASLATFFLLGLWHGVGLEFVFMASVMGISAVTVMIWGDAFPRVIGKKRAKSVQHSLLYRLSGASLAFCALAVAISAFWLDLAELQAAHDTMGTTGTFLAIAILVAMFLPTIAALLLRDTIMDRIAALAAGLSGIRAMRQCFAGIQIAVVVLFVFLVPTDQLTFVYEGF